MSAQRNTQHPSHISSSFHKDVIKIFIKCLLNSRYSILIYIYTVEYSEAIRSGLVEHSLTWKKILDILFT